MTRIYRAYGASAAKRRSWSAENPGNQAIRRELVDAVFAMAGTELRAARAVLDVGCGTGWWLAELAGERRIGAALHGVELAPARVAAAQARVPSATIRSGDARALDLTGGGFEVVTLFTVLSSLASATEAARAVGEARRVLAPRGVLLIWEPRIITPGNRATLLIGRRLLQDALAGCRLQIRSVTVAPPLARRLGPATDRLYPLLAGVPALRTHRLVCARVD